MASDDSNVRSIQGEQQDEPGPGRRVKFNGMSKNPIGEALPRGGWVKFTVEGRVIGRDERDREDGLTQFWDVVKVDTVELADKKEPEHDASLFDVNDDVAEG